MVDKQNTTDNHGWEYPAPGYDASTPTWGELLNALFEEDLDNAVIIKDVYDNRPAPGEQDRWFLATDRRIAYYDDGQDWEAMMGLGTTDHPVPGTTHLESLRAEEQQVGGVKTVGESVTINDDSVQTVDASFASLIIVQAVTSNAIGHATLQTEFNDITDALLASSATNQGSSSLSGTTGPDGSLNISRNDNNFNLENRTGEDPIDVEILLYKRQ